MSSCAAFSCMYYPTAFTVRHYGLLANAGRRQHLACVRGLLHVPSPIPVSDDTPVATIQTFICRGCGGLMHVAEVIMRRQPIREPP